MRVEIALDPAQLVSLASRVSGKAPADPAARAPRAARGGRGGKAPRPARKTAEELDADMVVSLGNASIADVNRRTRIQTKI